MSLNQYSKEQLQEMSFIEITYDLLVEKKQAIPFNEIMDVIIKALNLSEKEVKSRIAQFYTDMNIDGRFLALGDNRWGLRVWYPVDHVEEEVVPVVKPKKKKAKKAKDEDDFDEVEEEIGFDDIDEFEEEVLDEDDSFDEDDLDVEDDDDLIDDDLDIVDDEDLDESDDVLDPDEDEEEDL
ncbi:DNA-directed RNA polymerase subunit delta [Bacillus sp. 1NLA3E]|uniref:DNA-directed RNA polymerase subunit delta n=1 Tax=Bacillus sp. 1NLA3E TaxID=666686 RepID=UPI000247F111|nr:DNA-directed RNA polymerase subunit delta [Bacillus sp. 1NLA3E]AGK56064.1 DNA-directed RNA polymerase subunit delta [Bacillus sp. 1NLA3E]